MNMLQGKTENEINNLFDDFEEIEKNIQSNFNIQKLLNAKKKDTLYAIDENEGTQTIEISNKNISEKLVIDEILKEAFLDTNKKKQNHIDKEAQKLEKQLLKLREEIEDEDEISIEESTPISFSLKEDQNLVDPYKNNFILEDKERELKKRNKLMSKTFDVIGVANLSQLNKDIDKNESLRELIKEDNNLNLELEKKRIKEFKELKNSKRIKSKDKKSKESNQHNKKILEKIKDSKKIFNSTSGEQKIKKANEKKIDHKIFENNFETESKNSENSFNIKRRKSKRSDSIKKNKLKNLNFKIKNELDFSQYSSHNPNQKNVNSFEITFKNQNKNQQKKNSPEKKNEIKNQQKYNLVRLDPDLIVENKLIDLSEQKKSIKKAKDNINKVYNQANEKRKQRKDRVKEYGMKLKFNNSKNKPKS